MLLKLSTSDRKDLSNLDLLDQKNTLFIVPTPIGNLSDISQRSIDCLKNVDLIACEDTRHSAKLLSAYSIDTKTTSIHDHNERDRADWLVKLIQEGKNVALISDAGTPLISDPGYYFVNHCRANNVKVVSLPGPCALTTALSASGLPTNSFAFFGFLPVKLIAKTTMLQRCKALSMTCIFYEAPRRIADTLALCAQELPKHHRIVLAKELTKTYETYVSGTAGEVLMWLKDDPARQKGEFVLMVYCESSPTADELPEEAISLLTSLHSLLPPKKAASVVAEHYSLKKNVLYQYAIDHLK